MRNKRKHWETNNWNNRKYDNNGRYNKRWNFDWKKIKSRKINEAIKDENNENFEISLLAKNLEENGIITAVEKNAYNQDKDIMQQIYNLW